MADITQMIADLREMVASSINPDNGPKSITGAAINLAFNAVIDAIEEAAKTGGGGGGAEIVYATVSQDSYPLTEPQIAANIAVWQKAKDAYEQGYTIPQIVIDLSSASASIMGQNVAYVINPIQLMCAEGENGEGFGLVAFAIDYMGKVATLELIEDGIAIYESMS